jgi:hypothetical protein
MRQETKTFDIYEFKELDGIARDKVLAYFSDINVDYNWWEFTYIDASKVQMRISRFDIGRGNYVELEFMQFATDTANSIIDQHGEQCDTHKEAKEFLQKWDELVVIHSNGVNTSEVAEEKQEDFDHEAEILEGEFLEEMKNCYLTMLKNEYEFLTSEEAIIETIEANGYEFLEDGELYDG